MARNDNGSAGSGATRALTATEQHVRGFVVGALAACGAVTFTNPWESQSRTDALQPPASASIGTGIAIIAIADRSVRLTPATHLPHTHDLAALFILAAAGSANNQVVKTRLQLQGELQNRRSTSSASLPSSSSPVAPPAAAAGPKPYPNAISAFVRIARNEGIAGIQKGLAPAYAYQILLNGTRLGLYDPLKLAIQNGIDRVAGSGVAGSAGYKPAAPVVAMVLSGAASGTLGAMIASPLFLIKTRMQSYTTSLAVGHQHSYVTKGLLFSLKTVYRNEGLRGLWRGADASMVRTGVGSAVQLSSYDGCKQMLLRSGWFDTAHNGGQGGISLHFMASLVTSFFVCIAMNPFDVASTRMYNQHVSADGKTGSLYKNGLDCIVKTVRAEGPVALYKGFFAHYLRIGPHTILTFVFLEQLRSGMAFLDRHYLIK
ncbi:mitochondrial carrier domain-containing protein [Entophlyctis helioformis]|nr:mitochondrial carrier domain-containing protein [Entophlyctis helioformis]